MLFNPPTITIISDICIEWLKFYTKPKDSGLKWELYPGNHMIVRPRGKFQISEFLRRAIDAIVFSPELQDIEICPLEVLCSQR